MEQVLHPNYMSEILSGTPVGADSAFLSQCDIFAISKWPDKSSQCRKSPFLGGYHRVGSVPIYSVLDDGMPGDISRVICLHCGEVMKDDEGYPEGYFHAADQPRTAGTMEQGKG